MILVRSQFEAALVQPGSFPETLEDASILKGEGKLKLLNVYLAEKVKG